MFLSTTVILSFSDMYVLMCLRLKTAGLKKSFFIEYLTACSEFHIYDA